MADVAEMERLALNLPDTQRAVLAARLLRSLPAVLHDEDEGITEALRRDAEMQDSREQGLSLEQLDRLIGTRRP
ncbi:MAG TPA: addiction module protein [Verrucomicrobiota bacterium]|nr:addiction module protein [Verrucomicrobiota bacterium]